MTDTHKPTLRKQDPRLCVCGDRRDEHLAWRRLDNEGKPDEAGPCRQCPCAGWRKAR